MGGAGDARTAHLRATRSRTAHVVAVCGLALFARVASAQDVSHDAQPPAATESLNQAISEAPAEKPNGSKVIRRDKSAARGGAGTSAATGAGGTSWIRTTASLGGVVAVVLFLAWGYRAIAGRGAVLLGRGRRNGAVEILSRTSLSARQSLCLVRVGPRAVLLGVTGDSVRTLDVIDDPAVVAQLAGQAAGSSKADFDAALKTQERAFTIADRGAAGEDDLAESTIRAIALKQKLAGAADRLAAAR